MTDLVGKKVLVSLSSWFYAPDGRNYNAVWGTLTKIESTKEHVGFDPPRGHANWVVIVDDLTIMGCQVIYMCSCPEQPNLDPLTILHEGKAIQRDSFIYVKGAEATRLYIKREQPTISVEWPGTTPTPHNMEYKNFTK